MALAGLTGLVTGVAVWLLVSLVHLVQQLAWSTPVPSWQVVLVPTVGAMGVGLLVWKVVPEVSGGGVVTTLEALAIRGGKMRRRVPAWGVVANSLALGTGTSGGREGPILLIGGAIGSAVSRLVPLDEDRTRSLVAAGAAAGIGATFNAPIGGMLFAIELLLGGIRRAGSLQAVVVASVVSAVTARTLVGESLPLFNASSGLGLGEPTELLLYALLGVAAVAVAWLFRRGENVAAKGFGLLRRAVERKTGVAGLGIPIAVTLGGLIVGLIALAFPEVLGEGSGLPAIDGRTEPIQAMLDGDFGTQWSAAGLLLALLVAKLVASSATVGSGSAVGSFAPSLFLGAALGGAFGVAATELLGTDVRVGSFALVGMAAVFAGMARAPLTAILIVFELTGSYDLVLPLMLAVGVVMFVTELRGWESVYIRQLRDRGVVYGQPDDLDVLQLVMVEEVMTAATDSVVISEDASLAQLRDRFELGVHGYVVVDKQQRLVGVVTVSDLERADRGTKGTVGEVCTRRAITVEPSDPVFRAVRRMAALDVGRVPVITPTDRRVVGVLRRSDVVRAYQRGISRSMGAQHRAESGRLRNLTGLRSVEVVVAKDAAVDGQAVRDVGWPERTVLVSVRREGEVLVPTGTTVLEAADELVALTGHSDELTRLVTEPVG